MDNPGNPTDCPYHAPREWIYDLSDSIPEGGEYASLQTLEQMRTMATAIRKKGETLMNGAQDALDHLDYIESRLRQEVALRESLPDAQDSPAYAKALQEVRETIGKGIAQSALESLHPDARPLWVLYHEFLWHVLPDHPERWPELVATLDSAIAAGGPAAELAERLKNPPSPPRVAFGVDLGFDPSRGDLAKAFGPPPDTSPGMRLAITNGGAQLITITNLGPES